MKKKPPLALVVCACFIIGTASNVLAVGAGGTWKFDLGSQTVHQNRALTFDHDGGELTGKANSEAGAPNFYLFAQHLFKGRRNLRADENGHFSSASFAQILIPLP